MAKKPETNVAFVTRMMEFSKYGPLAQLFVLEALVKWSNIIADKKPADVDTPLISGEAWIGVAKDIKAKLAERLGEA